ncbi:glucose-6-phosphate isomerase [Buchnera aphidicola (Chaitoregma tattakana)]|uniref:glucose-6-phosphate isomerase n=1 Tax=Buchnera aphidicola TaxID=9 RepID=UPI0031B830E2
MKYKNFKDVKSWKNLQNRFLKLKNCDVRNLFTSNKNRFKEFSINFLDKMIFDYSKNIIDSRAMNILFKLAEEIGIVQEIKKMFSGSKINETENNSVLHVSLRNYKNKNGFLKDKNTELEIKKCFDKMKNFSIKVINGIWKGCTNKKITDIVNIGIGGSELGPQMINNALKDYKNHLNIHYISNIDNTNLKDVLDKINLETSLFLIVSKTFTTTETIVNANSIKKCFIKKFNNKNFINKHFFAISNNVKNSINFGICKKNIFKIFSWVGGRYSVWSSVGLSIMLSIGHKNFFKFLEGANKMDNHFYKKKINKNIPIILALISFWYNFFFNSATEVILTYSNRLNKFTSYIQQLNMESNGKNCDRNGKRITYNTSQIIWGGTGTNCQHSFFQLLHQGTRLVPCDFVAFVNGYDKKFEKHNIILLSNFFAQTKSLFFGNCDPFYRNKENIKKHCDKFYKKFYGNIPSNSIMFKKLDPISLGILVAMYEHKVFVQGIILNIFSFDQWGVELGKTLSNDIYNVLKMNNHKDYKYDSSTNGLLNYYNSWKE